MSESIELIEREILNCLPVTARTTKGEALFSRSDIVELIARVFNK